MFQHILCTLRHAGELINGIVFKKHPAGMISVDPVEGDHLKIFSAIEGFHLVNAEGQTEEQARAAAQEEAAQAADQAAADQAAAVAEKVAETGGDQGQPAPPVDGASQSTDGAAAASTKKASAKK